MAVKGSSRLHKRWGFALGLAAIVALVFTGVVSAAEPALQQVDDTKIENFFKREQIAYNDQTRRLESAHTIIDKVQGWIDAMKGKGKDVSALESALSAYQAAVDSAQTNHDTAGALIDAAAGFDAGGNVTDRKAALQTVRDAGRPLRQAHLTLVQGTLDFRIAVQNWRAANK